jgi:hydrogenase large subunit
VCEVTQTDLIKLQHYIDETFKFFEENLVHLEGQSFLECDNIDNVLSKEGDLAEILKIIQTNGWLELGKSYDRYIVFGENSYFHKGKSVKTRLSKNISLVSVKETEQDTSYAKNVSYKNKYYEVGPLARAMINKTPLIKDAHKKYGDSMLSRILARVCEISQLLEHSKKLISKLDLSEASYIEPSQEISKLTATGYASVEAARGSLIHKVELENGLIKNYEIITPTQWNLSGGTKERPGVSQKAMIGLEDIGIAELVFKTFDVCSVCTTH